MFYELNKLSYQVEEDEKRSRLWFELLVDGETVENLIKDEKAIPHYYFEDDENDLPYYINYENKKLHFLGVCICGHDGCGNIACEMEKDENFVNLKVFFYGSGYKPAEDIKFRFSRENYDSVIGEIRKRAKEYKEANENK